MSWKRWKRGLLIAVLTGLATGVVAEAAGVTIKQLAVIVAVDIGKDLLLYLKQHPIESIKETEFVAKPPLRVQLFLLLVTCLAFTGCARLVSHQVRTESDGARVESWQKVTTFWDSKSTVAKLRATSTDKTVGLTLAGVDQETSASNAVTFASEIVGAAVRAAIKP